MKMLLKKARKLFLKEKRAEQPTNLSRRKLAMTFAAVGALSLVPLLASMSPADAVSIPPDMLGRIIFNAKNFGAKGDGATDDAAAINRVIAAAGVLGGVAYFPASSGAYMTSQNCLIALPNVTIYGDGKGASTIKAMNGAGASGVISITGDGFSLIDITIDGNRANNGLSNISSYGVYSAASHQAFINAEVTNCPRIGVGYGTTTATRDFVFDRCFIHHNGGTSANSVGVGIMTIGAGIASDLRVTNSRFEENHSFVLPTGDSSALNIQGGGGVLITGCTFLNNLNVNGGQVIVSDDVDGSHGIFATISNNFFQQTYTAGGDITCGVEIQGCDFVVSSNIFSGIITGDGIRVEGASQYGTISANQIYCVGACVNFINTAGSWINVTGNEFTAGLIGVSVQGAGTAVSLVANDFGPAVTTKVAGLANIVGAISGNRNASLIQSFTATLGGCTTAPSFVINFNYDGQKVTIDSEVFITAISNAATKTLSYVPAHARPSSTRTGAAFVYNGTAWVYAVMTVDTNGVLSFYADAQGSALPSSGTFSLQKFSFTYAI